MNVFTKEYNFVWAWLWHPDKVGCTRRTIGKKWGGKRCADVADMLKAYTAELQATVERQTKIIAGSDQTTPQYNWVEPTKSKNAYIKKLEEKHRGELKSKNDHIRKLEDSHVGDLNSQQLRIKDLQQKYESQYAETERLEAELHETVPVEEHNRVLQRWQEEEAKLLNAIKKLEAKLRGKNATKQYEIKKLKELVDRNNYLVVIRNDKDDKIKKLKAKLHGTVPTAYHDDLMNQRQKLEVSYLRRIDELEMKLEKPEATTTKQKLEAKNTFWACKKHANNNTLRCALCDEDRIKVLEAELKDWESGAVLNENSELKAENIKQQARIENLKVRLKTSLRECDFCGAALNQEVNDEKI
jgi:hypothetical protein